MSKLVGYVLLLAGTAIVAMATPTVPEINPSNASSAVALLSGGLLVLRSRRRS
jgi:MYXO-CTERM domain-containing protein